MTLAEDKKQLPFAIPPPHWKYLLGTGCPTQIENDGVQPATERHFTRH